MICRFLTWSEMRKDRVYCSIGTFCPEICPHAASQTIQISSLSPLSTRKEAFAGERTFSPDNSRTLFPKSIGVSALQPQLSRLQEICQTGLCLLEKFYHMQNQIRPGHKPFNPA